MDGSSGQKRGPACLKQVLSLRGNILLSRREISERERTDHFNILPLTKTVNKPQTDMCNQDRLSTACSEKVIKELDT